MRLDCIIACDLHGAHMSPSERSVCNQRHEADGHYIGQIDFALRRRFRWPRRPFDAKAPLIGAAKIQVALSEVGVCEGLPKLHLRKLAAAAAALNKQIITARCLARSTRLGKHRAARRLDRIPAQFPLIARLHNWAQISNPAAPEMRTKKAK